MLEKIILASSNDGKLKELRKLFERDHVEILPQSRFNVPDADETGLTFVENAIIKARNACVHTGLPAIADDSGLEVDILEGRPGIYSARYAGENRTTKNYCDRLLKELEGVPKEKRTARFQSRLVFMRHEKDPSPLIAEGTWEGVILTEPRGTGGFGYDPVFYVESLGCTAAELSLEKKNRYSHRSQAMQSLLRQLENGYFHE